MNRYALLMMMQSGHDVSEMDTEKSHKHIVHHEPEMSRRLDISRARKWVHDMHHADGSTGEHWTYEQAGQLMRQKSISCDPAEFYAAVNMLWSDYCRVAQRIGQDNNDFWSEMAKAFLMDKDAKPNKLSLYYECIAK